MTKKAGMDSTEDSTVLLIVLNFFMYVISCAIFQDKLNAIWNSIPDSGLIESHSDDE